MTGLYIGLEKSRGTVTEQTNMQSTSGKTSKHHKDGVRCWNYPVSKKNKHLGLKGSSTELQNVATGLLQLTSLQHFKVEAQECYLATTSVSIEKSCQKEETRIYISNITTKLLIYTFFLGVCSSPKIVYGWMVTAGGCLCMYLSALENQAVIGRKY